MGAVVGEYVEGTADTRLTFSAVEFCVLALLAQRSTYGFDLIRRLNDVHRLPVTEGSVYPLLSRLRRDGAVAAVWKVSDVGPPRRYYELTSVGEAALKKIDTEWQTFRDCLERIETDKRGKLA